MWAYRDHETTRAFVAILKIGDGSFAAGVELTKPGGQDHTRRAPHTAYCVMSLLINEPEIDSNRKAFYYVLREIIKHTEKETKLIHALGNIRAFFKKQEVQRKVGQFANENGFRIITNFDPQAINKRHDPLLLANDAINRKKSIVSYV